MALGIRLADLRKVYTSAPLMGHLAARGADVCRHDRDAARGGVAGQLRSGASRVDPLTALRSE